MKRSPSSRPTRRRWRLRGLVFRLAAVVLGLIPLVLAEAVFAFLGWGRPGYEEDPFVGFRAEYPLFVRNDEGTRWEIPRSRQIFFCPESFAAKKPSNEFRIFCLGGSTVQGRPFAVETSFTTWLEINLRAADPRRGWEVVNCGGVSYASYRLVPILKEVLGYDPDLIILYTGHNEFLEDRTYRHIKYMPRAAAWPCALLTRTRTYTLLRKGYLRLRGGSEQTIPEGRPILQPETDAMLEHQGGLEQYHRDEKWRRDVIEHFRYNLRRMTQMAHDARVPMLLVNPVCNLRDCAPFKTQHRDGLTPDELQQCEALVFKAQESAFRSGKGRIPDLPRAVELLKQAIAIDDRHAGIHYLLATCYDRLGKMEEAREAYIRAKEEDICPLRILEPMHEAILEVARQTGTPLVDVRDLFRRHSEAGIPGKFLLLDHVHPSIESHRLIADALAEELVRQGVVRPVPDWKETKDRRFGEHYASLDDLYFAKGQERLEALRLWTQGRAGRVRPKP